MKFEVSFVKNERKDNSLLEAVGFSDDNVFFVQPSLHAVVALGQGLHADRVKSRFNSSSRSNFTRIKCAERGGRLYDLLSAWIGECSAHESLGIVSHSH